MRIAIVGTGVAGLTAAHRLHRDHEIAVYEELITFAQAMGRDDVVALLQANLEQEQHTLEEVRRAAERIAQETLQPA